MTSWTDYQDDISDAISDSMDVDWSASVGAQAVVAWLNEHKPLPAAPAPEGGAVDDEALKIATELHTAFEKLIYGLPKYLDTENLTDEENMICEAWVTLDVTAHRLAALATREEAPANTGECPCNLKADDCHPDCPHGRKEAPAEAGEPKQLDRLFYAGGEYVRADEAVRQISELKAELSALRAQPPAREDAQPVAYDARKLKKGDQVWIRVTVTDPCTSCCGVSVKSATGSEVHRYIAPADVRAHPAPDALRVAVEALEKIKAVRVCKESANIWTGADACRKIATEALAALQAEQKGGA